MPHGLMREMMETYKPHILTRRRQLLEDCVRDLRLNNDHIHIVEQEMRKAIQVRKQINKKNFVKTFFTKKCVKFDEENSASIHTFKIALFAI